MVTSQKKRGLTTPSTARKHLKRVTLLTILVLILFTPRISKPTYSQANLLEIRVASGYPEELPADGESTTVVEFSIGRCFYDVPIDSNGTFSVTFSVSSYSTISTDGTISFLGGDLPEEPVQLLFQSSTEPGLNFIDVKISYCPADGIVLMGVCSDPDYVDTFCSGSMPINIYDPERTDSSRVAGQTSNPDPATSEQATSEQAMSEQTTSEQTMSEQVMSEQVMSENEASSEILMTELYNDLEEYLAGEGITAPTPRQIGTSGIAITTLLAGWLVLNQMAGTSAEKSFEVIKAWKDGERPPIGVEVELPADLEDGDVGIEGDLPEESPYPADEEQSAPLERTPVQESGEDRLLRGVKDAQDYDDTLKKINKDIESFEGKIPDQVKNSEAWKKHVAPKWKKAKDLAKKGELDKARTWLDRAEKLIKVREEVDRDLDHLPSDQREGIVWVERTIKTLAHVASDAYETFILKPIKAVAEKILPARGARVITKSVDEVGQGVSDVGQGIGELARKGGRLVSHGKTQDNLQHTMQTAKSQGLREEAKFHSDMLAGKDRKVPPVYPDWTKSPRKVLKLYENFKKWAFGNR